MTTDELSDLRKRAQAAYFIPSSDVLALLDEVDRLRAVEAAAREFVEPMRRYRKHVTWLKGDEDLLIAAAEALDAALKGAST